MHSHHAAHSTDFSKTSSFTKLRRKRTSCSWQESGVMKRRDKRQNHHFLEEARKQLKRQKLSPMIKQKLLRIYACTKKDLTNFCKGTALRIVCKLSQRDMAPCKWPTWRKQHGTDEPVLSALQTRLTTFRLARLLKKTLVSSPLLYRKQASSSLAAW